MPIRTAISLSGRQLCKESLTFYTLKSIIFNGNLLCLKSPIMLLGAYTEKKQACVKCVMLENARNKLDFNR